MKFQDLTGHVFSRLTVTARAPSNSYGHTRWHCKCSCGSDKTVYAADLKLGKMQSCGCLRRDLARLQRTLPEGEAAANSLYASYKKGAKERGIQFELTAAYFKSIVAQPCHYCGAAPSLKVFGVNRMKHKNVNGNFTYTGIDRKDSALGYSENNCVPCCKTCNFAKNDMKYTNFIVYLNQLIEFRTRKI